MCHVAGRPEQRHLAGQLGEFDAESENLRISRKALLTLPAPSPTSELERPDIPDRPVYPQILTALADAGRPMRARDLCQALDGSGYESSSAPLMCRLLSSCAISRVRPDCCSQVPKSMRPGWVLRRGSGSES